MLGLGPNSMASSSAHLHPPNSLSMVRPHATVENWPVAHAVVVGGTPRENPKELAATVPAIIAAVVDLRI